MSVTNPTGASIPSRPADGFLRRHFYDPKSRAIVFQVLLVAVIVFTLYSGIENVIFNLRKANIASGFGFLSTRAGFDVAQSLIDYTSDSSYGRAIVVGILNTLLIAVISIILATLLGFVLGVAQLSPNWLLKKLIQIYIEIFRNVPILVQLLFWHKGVLALLSGPKQALALPFGSFLSNRGLVMPRPVGGPGSWLIGIAVLVAIVACFVVARWAKQRLFATGQPFPVLWTNLGILIALPLIVFLALGEPITFDMPALKGFNFAGGINVVPEFLAMLLGMVGYASAFIAETVRSGVQSVSYGQWEAATSLGLKRGQTTRLIIIPQALRVIIPPMTSHYLSLTKNSSLALAVGYPDLVAVTGTVLNQSGQAVEVIGMVMVIYLTISLITSLVMNWYNGRIALVER